MAKNHKHETDREWVRVQDACAHSSIGRTTLYANLDINGGAIVTSLIRRKGARKGIRLINLESLRDFIELGIGETGEEVER